MSYFTTHFVVFIFEQTIFTTCDVSLFLRWNMIFEISKQRRTALSEEEQREVQELDNRMCCHHIKSPGHSRHHLASGMYTQQKDK
jgi:hypothetical protein